MSRKNNTSRPRRRFNPQGRPVFHNHGSRRAALEREVTAQVAIAEHQDYDEPLADWERELLGWGIEPIEETRETYAERMEREDREHRERRRREFEATKATWAQSAQAKASDDALDRLRSTLSYGLTRDDRAKVVTKDRRLAVHQIAHQMGVTSVQAMVFIRIICDEYVKTSSSTVATITANYLIELAKTESGQAFLNRTLVENGMSEAYAAE